MKNNALIIVVATVMIFSSFAVALSGTSTSFNNGYASAPAAGSGSPFLGDVTIYANGTVSNANVFSVTGNTFTLLSGINGSLTVLRNNTVINGNGFTVNGNGSTAVYVTGVTGLTIENILVVNATEGIYLYVVNNTMLNNNTIVGSSSFGEYMVDIEYSSNATVQNSNFELNSTATGTYGVYAYADTSVNVSYNMFSGSTIHEFIFSNYVGQFSAWHNTIMSTNSAAYGIYFESGEYATIGYNYMNNTYAGLYGDWAQSLLSTHNQFYNVSEYGIEIYYLTTFTSSYDIAPAAYYGAVIEEITNALLQHDNLSNSTYAVYSEYNIKTTVEDSNLSSTYNAVYAYEDAVINLYNDQMYMGPTGSYGVDSEYTSGWTNLVGDYIYIPNDEGLYLSYSPQFNVSDSYINASYDIYLDTSVNAATITNNTFITMSGEYTVYLDDYSFMNNFYFTNNTVTSPNSSWAEYGIYGYISYGSFNIVISGNSFTNNYYPVYLEADSYGSGLKIQNNTFLNTSLAVTAYYYSNVIVTGNTIINVSDEGIYLYSDGAGQSNISYNLIENLPGFGSMSYGIDLEYYYTGTNIVSHNTVLNGGSSSYGFYLYENLGTWVFDNFANDSEYAYYLEENNVLSFFNNTAEGSYCGIYSYENSNFQYYGNTLTNNNFSLYSEYDYSGTVFANTIQVNYSNATSTIYFLYLYEPYGQLSFYHNNFLNETTNSTTANYYYPYSTAVFMNAPLPVGGNYWSNYTGTGSDGIGTVPMNVYGSLTDYYPLTSMWTSPTVTFLELGLPSGTPWAVTLGSSMLSSSTGSIVYSPDNAQYTNVSYSISHVPGYVASATSGSVYLNGVNRVVTVTFTQVAYGVTFTESNLPSGTSWSVTLNGNTKSSTTSSIGFSVPNGTYSYSVAGVTGYHTTASGNVSVNGAAQSVQVTFLKNTYTLTINEKGLPAGDNWTVNVDGTDYTSTSTSITVTLTSGTYNITVTAPSGYTVSNPSNATINNSGTAITVTFAQKASGSGAALATGIGVGVVIGAAVASVAVMFLTGTGMFSGRRKQD